MITTKHVKDFKDALDEERFYDAHEVLEELWFNNRKNPTNEVKLIKGFINAAVSFELHKRGRIDASERVWKTYLKYRPLLFKTTSTKVELYHKISLHVEGIKKNLS
jgi:hypothetical protein